MRTHGASHPGNSLYGRWKAMRSRCENPNATSYKRYGARGIIVCREWHSYEPFCEWALANGYKEDLQLDRVNNDGNYEPGNCHFVKAKSNSQNRDNCVFLTAFGETKVLQAWWEDARCVVGISTLRRRVNDGWEHEQAITVKAGRVFNASTQIQKECMDLLTTKEAAEMMGASQVQVQRWAQSGKLPSLRVHGHYFIDPGVIPVFVRPSDRWGNQRPLRSQQ